VKTAASQPAIPHVATKGYYQYSKKLSVKNRVPEIAHLDSRVLLSDDLITMSRTLRIGAKIACEFLKRDS
jgi:hypothetical protein